MKTDPLLDAAAALCGAALGVMVTLGVVIATAEVIARRAARKRGVTW